MNKKARQKIILEVVNEHKVETQEDLLALLSEQQVEATQATISRDIRELSLVKQRDQHGKVYYRVLETQQIDTQQERLEMAINDYVVSVTRVQFMLVVKTSLGTADAVAAIFDEGVYKTVVGTIAGTDTLVLICQDPESANLIAEFINAHIEHV